LGWAVSATLPSIKSFIEKVLKLNELINIAFVKSPFGKEKCGIPAHNQSIQDTLKGSLGKKAEGKAMHNSLCYTVSCSV